MTLPDERYRAVKNTRMFLLELTDPTKTPRIPKHIRQTASWCLRHYPSEYDLKRASNGSPEVFAETMEDVSRMFMKYEQGKNKNEA